MKVSKKVLLSILIVLSQANLFAGKFDFWKSEDTKNENTKNTVEKSVADKSTNGARFASQGEDLVLEDVSDDDFSCEAPKTQVEPCSKYAGELDVVDLEDNDSCDDIFGSLNFKKVDEYTALELMRAIYQDDQETIKYLKQMNYKFSLSAIIKILKRIQQQHDNNFFQNISSDLYGFAFINNKSFFQELNLNSEVRMLLLTAGAQNVEFSG